MLPSPPLQALTSTDRLGKKNEQGFYRYEGGREKGVDESVYRDVASALPARAARCPSWRVATNSSGSEGQHRRSTSSCESHNGKRFL